MRTPLRLDVLQIANPCPENWDAMHGDARRRFCDRCQLHVHNLGAMPRDEAETLLAANTGRLCVRLPARRMPTSRWRRAGRALVAPLVLLAILTVMTVGFARELRQGSTLHHAYLEAKARLTGWWWPTPTLTPVMGDIAPMGKIQIAPSPPTPQPNR